MLCAISWQQCPIRLYVMKGLGIKINYQDGQGFLENKQTQEKHLKIKGGGAGGEAESDPGSRSPIHWTKARPDLFSSVAEIWFLSQTNLDIYFDTHIICLLACRGFISLTRFIEIMKSSVKCLLPYGKEVKMLTCGSFPISQKFRVSDFFSPPGCGGSFLSNI